MKAVKTENPILPKRELICSSKPSSAAVYFITRAGITVTREIKKHTTKMVESLEFNLVLKLTTRKMASKGLIVKDSKFKILTIRLFTNNYIKVVG
jgi:hypothetical protein